jgi:hypothetical protein
MSITIPQGANSHLLRSFYVEDSHTRSVMTRGVSEKPVEQITEADGTSANGGLREANWPHNVLVFVTDHPEENGDGQKVLKTFLASVKEWASWPTSKFVLAVDHGQGDGKKCHPIHSRVLGDMLEDPSAKKIPEVLHKEIDAVARPFLAGPQGVRSRRSDIIDRALCFNEVFPSPECDTFRNAFPSEGGVISPKKCLKQLWGLKIPVDELKIVLNQYFTALKNHPTDDLVQKLGKRAMKNLKDFDKSYKGEHSEQILSISKKGIEEFQKAFEQSQKS